MQWDKPRRQSPVALIVSLMAAFREAWSLILIITASTFLRKSPINEGLNVWEKFGIALVGSFLATVVLKFPKVSAYFFYRFWIEDDNIIITQGILEKQRTVLPIEKIQTIQLQQNWIHRLTGTCSLIADTAGSEIAELNMDAIKLEDADFFQHLINVKRHQQSTFNETEKLVCQPAIIKLSTVDLLKLCISENHLRTLFIIIFFILGKLQDIRDYLGFDSFNYVKQNASVLKATTQSALIVLAVGFMLAIVFSFITEFIRYFHFQLVQQQKAFQLSWGLFSTHRKTMLFNKVQYITWHSNWIRRKLNLLLLRFHALAEQAIDTNLHVNMPVTNTAMLQQVIQSYIPILPSKTELRAYGIQKAYIWRKFFIIGLPITVVVGLILSYWIGWYALLVIVGLVYQTIANIVYQKNFRYWFNGVELQIEHGIWGRASMVIHVHKIIFVTIHTSPWQRKHGYASLEIQVAGGSWKIPYLKLEEAQMLADCILVRIEGEK